MYQNDTNGLCTQWTRDHSVPRLNVGGSTVSNAGVRAPRLLPAPDPNPPYDAPDVAWTRRPREAPGQGVLALEFLLPSGVPAQPAILGSADWGAAPAALDQPEAERWSRMLAQGIAEALSGSRPVAQLRFWVTRNVHRRLLTATRLSQGSAGYAVPTVHVHVASPHAVEAVATLRGVGHAHAMAFRLEARHGAWLCTAFDVGILPRPR